MKIYLYKEGLLNLLELITFLLETNKKEKKFLLPVYKFYGWRKTIN